MRRLALLGACASIVFLCGATQIGLPWPGPGAAGGGGSTPAIVTVCGNNASSAVASVALTCVVPAGDQIEVFGGYNSASTVTVTDGGDTFSTPAHTISGSNSVFSSHALSSPSGASTVTVTFGAANSFCTCMVVVMSGVTSVDVPESLGVPTASGTSYAWNTIATTLTNDLVLAFGSNLSANNTYTAGGSYTIPAGTCATTGTCGQMSGGSQSAMVESLLAVGTGNQSPTATGTTSLALANLLIAFH